MKLVFDPLALEDLRYWVRTDKKKAAKILDRIDNTLETPFKGVGKPEPLKHNYSGCWSRRIDREHRLVYKGEHDELVIFTCRYHY